MLNVKYFLTKTHLFGIKLVTKKCHKVIEAHFRTPVLDFIYVFSYFSVSKALAASPL
jgi:hypothetical protein